VTTAAWRRAIHRQNNSAKRWFRQLGNARSVGWQLWLAQADNSLRLDPLSHDFA